MDSQKFTTKYPDPPTLKPIFDEIREEGKKEVALNMLRKGYTVGTVVEITELSKEEVTELESEL